MDLLDPPHRATLQLTGSKVESLMTVQELRGGRREPSTGRARRHP
ncbi:hypothetical protein [Actinocatenispora sera]|nr:hypothetical protein [Actinocatenispora sera]